MSTSVQIQQLQAPTLGSLPEWLAPLVGRAERGHLVAITPDQRSSLSQRARGLEAFLAPAGRDFAVKIVEKIASAKLAGSIDGEVYVKVLASAPKGPLVMAAGDVIRSEDRFIPVVGEIWTRAQKIAGPRRIELSAILRLLGAERAPSKADDRGAVAELLASLSAHLRGRQ